MNRIVPVLQASKRFWRSPSACRRLLVIFSLQMGYLLGGIWGDLMPEMTMGLEAFFQVVQAEEAARQPAANRAAEVPSAKSEPAERPGRLQQQLQRELGEAALSEEENPLLSIFQQMREVEMLLGQGQTGPRTQQIQKQILADLDRLIEQAQQSGLVQGKRPAKGKPDGALASSDQGGSTPSEPKEPAPAAKQPPSKNPSGASPEEKLPESQQLRRLLQEVWGLLPAGQRQQMLETPVEEFLPKYKTLIIDYFHRLAELQAKEK